MADRVAAIRAFIAAQPDQPPGTTDYLKRVCQAAARTLSASGTGISVLTDARTRGVCGASDLRSERIEELQFVFGEGPCIDAFDSWRPVLVPDLAADGARWPRYGPAARAAGVRAVFAFPLQMGAARLGVLDVFRGQPGALSADELQDAMIFADISLEAMLDQGRATGDGMAGPVDHQTELFQAQGMVMVQTGGTISEAVARMRAHAYAEGRGLGEIARDVVARRLHFERDRPW